MGLYIFQHPKTEEIRELFFHMNDKKEYIDEDGVKWNRVYTVPNAAIDTKVDPMDANKFVEKTGKMKGTYGDLLDASREASEQREKLIGKDTVKEEYLKKWKSKRKKGAKHSIEVDRNINISVKE